MEDLSKVTGGRFISQKTGDNLENITLADFGRVNKVIVGEDSTVMIPLFEFNEVTNEYIKSLNTIKSGIVDKNEINFYNERISKIDGGISTIFIGGNSTIEQTETFDRAEDAVLAVKSAVEEGTLSGGGIGLINASASIQDSDDNNKQVAVEIMIQALREPFRRIVLNTGVDVEEVSRRIISENKVGFGYNAKNGEFGLMEAMGVVDAAKVTKSALKNAISVATTILSTNTIVSNKRAE
jgi:chaperonin GroEL